MKDIMLSIKGVLYERISSPFYGSFIFSFVVINWKIPIDIFFGDVTPEKRISIIEKLISDASVGQLLWGPLASALFITCVLPAVSTCVLWVWEWWQKNAREIVESYEKHKRLTVEQSNELRVEIDGIQERFKLLLEEKDKQIARLVDKNKIKEKLSKDQIRLLSLIKEYLYKFSLTKLVILKGGLLLDDADR